MVCGCEGGGDSDSGQRPWAQGSLPAGRLEALLRAPDPPPHPAKSRASWDCRCRVGCEWGAGRVRAADRTASPLSSRAGSGAHSPRQSWMA